MARWILNRPTPLRPRRTKKHRRNRSMHLEQLEDRNAPGSALSAASAGVAAAARKAAQPSDDYGPVTDEGYLDDLFGIADLFGRGSKRGRKGFKKTVSPLSFWVMVKNLALNSPHFASVETQVLWVARGSAAQSRALCASF